MITAVEVRERVDGSNKAFEENAAKLACAMVERVADPLVRKMIRDRKVEIEKEYSAKELFGPLIRTVLIDEAEDRDLQERARQIANDKIHEAGFEGGFSTAILGEPMYGGGNGRYTVWVLRLAC